MEDHIYQSLALPAQKPKPLSAHEASVSAGASYQQEARPPYTPFAEIEIGGFNISPSQAAPAAQAVPVRQGTVFSDDKRRRLTQMRQIARDGVYSDPTALFKSHEQRAALAGVFYKQARFMADFEDDYLYSTPFTAYYPYYQIMNFEQLRTYFTWRTRARKGDITDTSLAYAFLYIYEWLNNIHTENPADGLDGLVAFWRAFRAFNDKIDSYVLRWVKDYHVYYELPQSFRAFIESQGIYARYDGLLSLEALPGDRFETLRHISKYDISESGFYNDENFHKDIRTLYRDCVNCATEQLSRVCGEAGLDFDAMATQPLKKPPAWIPFERALFHPRLDQPDRRVVLSPDEIYDCRQNHWTVTTVREGNKHLCGYVLKQTESELRKAMGYKRKLTVNMRMIDDPTINILYALGINPEKIIAEAVVAFWTEKNKTVVAVDMGMLEKIRREALDIQEKLIVREDSSDSMPFVATAREMAGNAKQSVLPPPAAPASDNAMPVLPLLPVASANAAVPPPVPDEWAELHASLTPVERDALSLILHAGDFKRFAQTHRIMPEVLADSINEKAFDAIGDNVLDFTETAAVYDEYAAPLLRIYPLIEAGDE